MKALVYTAVRTVEVHEVDMPVAGPTEVLVRVGATGICGSDIHGFLGHSSRRMPGLILGHETVGIIEEGDESLLGKRVSVNPLITCMLCPACRAGRHNNCLNWRLLGMDQTHGGFGEYVTVPRRNVHPIPDSVHDEKAVMVEPLANAFHILSMIPQSAGLAPTAVIVGGGTIGACIYAVAQARGLQILAVSEPNPKRQAILEALGCRRVIDPRSTDVADTILAETNGQGVSLAIDAVGSSVTRNTCAKLVSRGGTALLLGLDEGTTSFDFFDLVRREVRLQTSFAYTEQNYAEALDFVVNGAVDFTPWTTSMPTEQGQQAFETLVNSPGQYLKIALVPTGRGLRGAMK